MILNKKNRYFKDLWSGVGLNFSHCYSSLENPDIFNKFYDKIGVGITIDRNPIGLHKLSPRFKGLVVIYITLETLIRYNNSGKKSYEFEMRSAFSSHLVPHFIYSISIMYKKRKYNITLAETRIILNQNNINRNHNVIID